jgi:glyceraldehyde 3-phosphate dehydrogenase
MKKIAINGFGRVGRTFYKLALADADIEIVAINDLGESDALAYLLRYDTVYGRYGGDVKIIEKDGKKYLSVGTSSSVQTMEGKRETLLLQEKDATKLPWGALDIDLVVECTGLFESFEKAQVHVIAGAKRVVISAPAKDADGVLGSTVLPGNEEKLAMCAVSSNGSCTTNAVAPVVQALSENPGILKAMLNTVHAYTATQSMVDGTVRDGKDFRRGRAAAQNIVPSTTGAAIAVARVVPELAGKFDGIAMRVPVPAGSIADITFVAKRPTTKEEVNDILRKASESPRWKGILKVTDEQIVSSDILGEPYGAIVDLNFTKVVDGDLVKVLSWYDNEYGYAAMLLRHVKSALGAN